jgi:phosphopantetheine adenylyltransferase
MVQIEVETSAFNAAALNKDSWLVILHANRIPPHIGLLINGNYNSLTIKGHELNVSIEALLKTISQKKIESIFINLKKHPVFSLDHQLNMFQEMVKNFDQVKQDHATCLTPIKLFFQEFYVVTNVNDELFFEFIKRLNDNSYLQTASALNFDLNKNLVEFPFYSTEQLNEQIKAERLPYYKD